MSIWKYVKFDGAWRYTRLLGTRVGLLGQVGAGSAAGSRRHSVESS